jgi:1-deoxy-D-xylulose-5-phosphate reductoisomerase
MTWPERVGNATLPRLDLSQTGALHFSEPDPARFPCLALARRAAAAGGVAPAAMNAANEAAVAAFLERRTRLPGIWETVAQVLGECPPATGELTLDAILKADAWARQRAVEIIA